MAESTQKALRIGEAAERTGVPERVLRYYDEKGIVCPSVVSRAGWRRYTEDDLLRVREVGILRECGYDLGEIEEIVNALRYDPAEALEHELAILQARRERLDAVIRLVQRIREGTADAGFDALERGEEAALRAAYKQHLWAKEGPEMDEKGAADEEDEGGGRPPTAQERFAAEASAILRVLGAHGDEGPEGETVQKCVRKWQKCIARHCCPCDDQTLLCLGALYARPGRLRDYINSYGQGGAMDLADLFERAIQAHVGRLRR